MPLDRQKPFKYYLIEELDSILRIDDQKNIINGRVVGQIIKIINETIAYQSSLIKGDLGAVYKFLDC